MRTPRNRTRNRRPSVSPPQRRPTLEELEPRNLLAAPFLHHLPPGDVGYSPAQVLTAYGFNQLGLAQPGLGQTIAVVDAFLAPDIQSDVATFDARYGLPALDLTVVNDGATRPDPTGGWDQETALDVEWAHAVAPFARIVLVEAADDGMDAAGVPAALVHAAGVAAGQPNVTVVSMSWGTDEFPTETQYDDFFARPGITFVAASGDNGTPPIWPAVSPGVVAVGGTLLQLDGSGNYISETGWGHGRNSPFAGGSGGGFSQYEAEPAYQQGDYATSVSGRPTSGIRMNPDVAYDASPSTGLAVYAGATGGWAVIGGTSAGTPQWAALVALADQVRATNNPTLPPLSSDETLATLYQAQADFHDVTAGNNGEPAGVGYDFVTGLGTPKADQLVPALAAARSNQSFVVQAYQSLLGRPPDPAGLDAWTRVLDQGISRSTVVLRIEQSSEFLGDQVQALYAKLLHRPADPDGLATFTALLANGGTAEQVAALIAGSAEYFQVWGGGQTSGFLQALYADILGRSLDPAGQAAFGPTLAQGTPTAAVAAAVFASDEYRRDLVNSYYQTYLGRPAESGGLATFAAALGQGTSDQEIIADILGSREYWS
jgi:hypothetical protein